MGEVGGRRRLRADLSDPSLSLSLLSLQHYDGCTLLAIADEEGYISIVDTAAPLPPSLHPRDGDAATPAPRAQWLCHANAVFDAAWTRGDTRLLTASGDRTVAVWDTLDATRVATGVGHAGSVKSVAPRPGAPDVFASGGRDGAVLLWDSRCPGAGTRAGGAGDALSPVAALRGAHGAPDAAAPRSRAGRRRPHSVTAVAWAGDLLLSGGADGAVRVWDARAGLATRSRPPAPVAEIWPAPARRRAGVTGLAVHPGTGRVAASLHGVGHALLHPALVGDAVLLHPDGAPPSSFYVKAAFSPSGDRLLGGAGDGDARVWEVARPRAAPARLAGHAAEVTGVAWCPADAGQVATVSDDASVRVWRLARREGAPSPTRVVVRRSAADLAGQRARQAAFAATVPTPGRAGASSSTPGARSAPTAPTPRDARHPPSTTPAAPLTAARLRPPSTARLRLAQRSLFEFLRPGGGGGGGGGGAAARLLAAAPPPPPADQENCAPASATAPAAKRARADGAGVAGP